MRVQPRGRHRLRNDHVPLGIGGSLCPERRPAGEHFVQNRTQRINVGGRSDRPQLRDYLLRGHVDRRAEYLVLRSQPPDSSPTIDVVRTRCSGVGACVGEISKLRDAEVEHLDGLAPIGGLRHEEVCGLEVAVHDVPCVCVRHGLQRLQREIDRLIDR